MSAQQELLQSLVSILPQLGELGARVAQLEEDVAILKGSTTQPAPQGGQGVDDVPSEDEEIDFLGQKFSMREMLSNAAATSGGGMAGLMNKVKNWKPGQPSPAAAAAAAPTPPASEPTKPT